MGAIGRLVVGQSQIKMARWLNLSLLLFIGFGSNFYSLVWDPDGLSKDKQELRQAQDQYFWLCVRKNRTETPCAEDFMKVVFAQSTRHLCAAHLTLPTKTFKVDTSTCRLDGWSMEVLFSDEFGLHSKAVEVLFDLERQEISYHPLNIHEEDSCGGFSVWYLYGWTYRLPRLFT